MTMFSTKYPNTQRTVSGANVAVFNNDVILAVDTSTLACSINLSEIAQGYWNTTWRLYIYDASNNAAVHNITINAGGTNQRINGATSLVISSNGGGSMIQVLSNTSFIATSTTTGGGGGGYVTDVSAISPLIVAVGGTSPVLSTQVRATKLIGRSSGTNGVMEEIDLGVNLKFTGSTLDVTGISSGGVTSVAALTLGTTGTDLTSTVADPSTTPVITLNVPTASATNRGALSNTDWSTFNGKVSGVTGTSPVSVDNTDAKNPIVSMPKSDISTSGYLTDTDWNVFNNKLSSAYTTIQGAGTPAIQRSTMNFTGSAVSISDVGGVTEINISGSGGGGYATIQDEGSAVTPTRTIMNFIGTSVAAADDAANSRTNLTIQAYNTVTDEGGAALAKRDILNFVGTGISAADDTTRTTITVNMAVIQNTVYVMKSGNDTTGLVERFDKAFLTIGAARTAALTAYPLRSENERVKIIVESGQYAEGIIIDDFIDYDLGNSVLSPPNITPNSEACISDNGLAYTATSKGKYTAMIYGNATFNAYKATPSVADGWYGLYISDPNSTNLNLFLQCNQINSTKFDPILMKTGKATVYANLIYNSKPDDADHNVVTLSTSSSYSIAPQLEIYNAKIYNNQTSGGVINACISFENTTGTDVNKCMLISCEVGHYSSDRPAINCNPTNSGYGQITLKDTLVYCHATVPSISDDTNAASVMTAFVYGTYASQPATYTNFGSATLLGTLTASTRLLFNQGNLIT